MNKKQIRAKFGEAVFNRDGHKCRVCGKSDTALDCHHITNRKLMPNGGYVTENGISLCADCHLKAEVFHATGEEIEGWMPDDLYALIGSSYEKAYEASKK